MIEHIKIQILPNSQVQLCFRRKQAEEARAKRAIPNDYRDPEYAGHAKFGSFYSYDKFGPSSSSAYNTNGGSETYDRVRINVS